MQANDFLSQNIHKWMVLQSNVAQRKKGPYRQGYGEDMGTLTGDLRHLCRRFGGTP